MAGGSGQLEIRGAFCSSICTEGVAHVVSSALGDVGPFEGFGPGFLDVDTPKCRFAGKGKGFLRISLFTETLEFFEDWIAERDAAGTSVLTFLDVGEFVFKVDVPPLEVENFTLAGTSG